MYIAFTIKENDKYYSYAARVKESANLIAHINPNVITAHVCGTRKHATELVTIWNESYKANGTYLFDCPQF